MVSAVEQLQVLNCVLDINDSASAVFDVHPSWLDQFSHLTTTHVQCILPVPRSSAITERVAVRFYPTAEVFISRDPPQFNERLPFKRRRTAVDTVIACKLFERN